MADDGPEEHEGHRPAGNALTRKWHGAPVWAWVFGGTVVVAVGVRWWRNRSAGGSGSSSSGTGTNTAENCYDISGALVPCAQAAANNASGGGDLGGTLGGILTGTTATGTTSSTTSSTGTGGPTTSSSGTSTSTGTPTSGRLTMPVVTGLPVKGKTGVKVAWLKVPGATGYVAQCKKGGENGQVVNGPFNVPASQLYANFGNLTAGTSYTALIWPSSATIPGGPGSNQPHAQYGFTTNK